MPYIETVDHLSTTEFVGATDVLADLGVELLISSNVSSSTSLNPVLSVIADIEALILGETEVDAFLRLNDEPNVLIEAEIEGASEFIPSPFLMYNLNSQIFSSTEVLAEFITQEAERHELYLMIDIYPPYAAGNYQHYKILFLINGVEVPIKEFSIHAPPSRIGTTINVTFSRPGDRNLLLASNSFSLDIGTVISGVTNWFRVLDEGNLVNDQYNIGWNENSPTDTVSFGTDLSLTDRLNLSPEFPIVIYDPGHVNIKSEDFEPLYDTQGNSYPTDLEPIGGLTLYKLFRKIFVDYLNFNDYRTNIPDYNVKRVDIQIGESYLGAIGGVFGVFEPLFFEKDNVLFIIDTTALLPPGFPNPRSITASTYKTLSTTRDRLNIEGYILQYSDDDKGWDYYTLKLEQDTTETGEGFQLTEIYTETYIREYRRFSQPSVVIKTDIESQFKTVRAYAQDGSYTIVQSSTERFRYDYLGRLLNRHMEVSSYVPWVEDTVTGNILFSLQSTRSEFDVYEYSQHPFERSKQYRKTLTQTVRGLIYIDGAQFYLDEAYERDYLSAHRMGIVSRFATTDRRTGPISTRTEKVFPQRDGTTKVEIKEVDHVAGTVTLDNLDEQPGSVAQNSLVPRSMEMIVYETDDHVRTGGLLESLSIGEIPVNIGIALARRKLKSARLKGRDLDMEYIGVDHTLKRGSLITLIGRGDEIVGTFLIEGYSISGSNLGTPQQVINSNFKGKEV